jgi:hypothetical protein
MEPAGGVPLNGGRDREVARGALIKITGHSALMRHWFESSLLTIRPDPSKVVFLDMESQSPAALGIEVLAVEVCVLEQIASAGSERGYVHRQTVSFEAAVAAANGEAKRQHRSWKPSKSHVDVRTIVEVLMHRVRRDAVCALELQDKRVILKFGGPRRSVLKWCPAR